MFDAAVRNGWTRVAFGDVVRQVRDRVNPEESGLERYVAGEHMDTDDLRIRRWGVIGDGYLGPAFHMRFKPGHVLYGSRRTYLRKVAVSDFEGVTANTTFVLEPKDPKVLLPAVLPFIMQTESFHEHSIKQSKGSVNPYVNFSDLTWYEFDLPPPEEQRRIVDILQTADGAIEKLEELKAAARVVECSLFETSLGNCHADPVPLGSLLLAPPRNGCSAQEASTSTGHWVLALSAITKQGYRRGELKAVEKTRVMEAALVRQGDLLLSRSNTRELVGLPMIFDEDRADVSWPDTMVKLTPDESRLRPRFLELYLRSPSGRTQVESAAAGTSASMKKINSAHIKSFSIPLPDPLTQDSLLVQTEMLRRAQHDTDSRIAEARMFRGALLDKLLSLQLAKEAAGRG